MKPVVGAPRSPDDLAALPEPVRACPNCASLGIRPARGFDGVSGGRFDLIRCPNCGFSGPQIQFDRREEYGEFLREKERELGVGKN